MRARKRFGQHFLEPAWAAKLVAALDVRPDDEFLEIGPGRGALTVPLARAARRIVAVEIDRDLAAAGRSVFPDNVSVIEGDVLRVDLPALLADLASPARVVGNLPYNVSSPILFRLLETAAGGTVLRDATLMLQREVADRVMATPGTREYGTLAVQVGLVSDVDRLLALPPGAFRPPPKVHSAVIRLRFRAPSADVGDPVTFAALVRGVFLRRRKTLSNALAAVAPRFARSTSELIERAGLDGTRRPETLSVDDFARLSRAVL